MISTKSDQPTQDVPPNLYDDGQMLVAVVPLPGITSDDIEIRVTDSELEIEGRLRGPRQDERHYLIHEWRYGPFRRRVRLSEPVDATRANATHGNGVLLVALPKADRTRPGTIHLARDAGSHHDQYQGHAGR